MAAPRPSGSMANGREIYLAGCWTAYRFQLALDAGQLERFEAARNRGVTAMRRVGKMASRRTHGHLRVVLPTGFHADTPLALIVFAGLPIKAHGWRARTLSQCSIGIARHGLG